MKDDKLKIEQRMKNMKKFYIKAGSLIDKLQMQSLKRQNHAESINSRDKELKNLMEGIDSHRPPRIFL